MQTPSGKSVQYRKSKSVQVINIALPSVKTCNSKIVYKSMPKCIQAAGSSHVSIDTTIMPNCPMRENLDPQANFCANCGTCHRYRVPHRRAPARPRALRSQSAIPVRRLQKAHLMRPSNLQIHWKPKPRPLSDRPASSNRIVIQVDGIE